MTDQRPADFEAAAELRRQLRDLGHDGQSTPRGAAQESARAARMAALIDAEVASLVAARARRRVLFGAAAAAALVAATFGLRHARVDVGALGISPEPVTASNGVPPTKRAEPPPPPPAVPLAVPSAVPRANSVPSAAAAPSVQPQSTLGEENRLFKAAAEAGRNGDVSGALAGLDKLLVEHPASPLAQTAMVRKFRLLATAGRADDARREAERYLLAYPSGFAVAEARVLTAGKVEPNAP